MYSTLFHYHMYHIYIYIQINFKCQQLTHIRNAENHLFIHIVIMSTARGDKNITRLGSPAGEEHCFPDPAPLHATFQKKPQGVQQWTRG